MKDKGIKRLSRGELLEILVQQSEEIDTLKQKLEETQKIVEERKSISENAGSIAKEVFALNGVFEAAEKAAEEYVKNVKELTVKKCREFQQQTRKKCEMMVEEAKREAEKYRSETRLRMKQLQALKTEYGKYKKAN